MRVTLATITRRWDGKPERRTELSRYRTDVPEMVPSSAEVSEQMSRVRNRNTNAELALRRALHRRGLRYRVNARLPDAGRSIPDITFVRHRILVFVDGCFWHRCPEHATFPKVNSAWWLEKLDRNVSRDRATNATLKAAGWTVVRVWEHEDPELAADRIQRAMELKTRSHSG
jgi:DNA mismatch endonuclease (patch repair protein)